MTCFSILSGRNPSRDWHSVLNSSAAHSSNVSLCPSMLFWLLCCAKSWNIVWAWALFTLPAQDRSKACVEAPRGPSQCSERLFLWTNVSSLFTISRRVNIRLQGARSAIAWRTFYPLGFWSFFLFFLFLNLSSAFAVAGMPMLLIHSSITRLWPMISAYGVAIAVHTPFPDEMLSIPMKRATW